MKFLFVLLMPCVLFSAPKSVEQNVLAQAKIFIIGDSTVHNFSLHELGWGSAIGKYLHNPKNVSNQAQAGASSKSYMVASQTRHDWAETKSLIAQTDIRHGAYLLIQFGHNDAKPAYATHYTKTGRNNTFYKALKIYIDEAKQLGVIPVLITPVSRFYRYANHGDYPNTMKMLAEDTGVLLLDLQKKSRYIFTTQYKTHDAVQQAFGYDDHTHFSQKGASVVAGWVRDLICDLNDKTLCKQFIQSK